MCEIYHELIVPNKYGLILKLSFERYAEAVRELWIQVPMLRGPMVSLGMAELRKIEWD